MVYYLCSEKGCGGTDHDCAGVQFVCGFQVCSPSSLQWQFDYAGKPFCACIGKKVDLDTDQIAIEV